MANDSWCNASAGASVGASARLLMNGARIAARRGARRALPVLAALLLGAAPMSGALAQEDRATMEQRVQQLELLVDQLRAELNAAQLELGMGSEEEEEEIEVEATGGGFEIEDEEAGHEFEFEGGLAFDYDFYDGIYNSGREGHRGDSASGGVWRIARLGFEGSYGHVWSYEFEVEIEDAEEAAEIDEAVIMYTGLEPLTLRVGKFTEPFALNELEDDFDAPLIERALLVDALDNLGVSEPGFGGVMASGFHRDYMNLNWALGVFDDDDEDADGDTSFAWTGRLAVAPYFTHDHFMHFGAAFSRRDKEGAKLEVASQLGVGVAEVIPELEEDDDNMGTNGDAAPGDDDDDEGGLVLAESCVDDVDQLGLEFAWVRGPLALQAEYLDVEADGADATDGICDEAEGDIDFDSHYVQLSWALTGETRPYLAEEGGYFGRLEPAGAWGAWELVARIESLDIDNNDDGEDAEVDKWLLGVNWHANKNVRFMVNYIDAEVDGDLGNELSAEGIDDDGEAWSFRAQYAW